MKEIQPTAVVTSFSQQTVRDLRQSMSDIAWGSAHIIDTYQAVCNQMHFKELYHAWLMCGKNAKDLIDIQWDTLTESIQRESHRRQQVIFADPALWERKTWCAFVRMAAPIVFNIELTISEAYKNLSESRKRHKTEANPNGQHFGIWDEGLLTRRTGNRFVANDRKQAAQRIDAAILEFDARLRFIPEESRYDLPFNVVTANDEVTASIATRINMHLGNSATNAGL